jgi:hypothetical protein
VAYGVTTSRAHLDVLGEALEPGEIDWDAIRAWKGADPQFAGRYFLGTPTQQEVDADVGFCLWAHGEGSDPSSPAAIVPIQRCDPTRQAAVGSLGTRFGTEDAGAIATYVERCADVGDLALPLDRYLVLVYLEVAGGTSLSFEYWSAWAHYLKGTLLEFHPHGIVRPLEPAIACAFVQDSPQAPFLPEEAVRTCLSHPALPGRYNLCKGFWCQTVLANPVFGQFVQDPDHGAIPVRYRRTFDGPGGSALPDPAPPELLSTLRLITVDEPTMDPDDPTLYTMEAQPWDPGVPPAFPPTQLGLDTAYKWVKDPDTGEVLDSTTIAERRVIAQCLATKTIVVRRLPAGSSGFDLGTHLDGDELRRPPAFIGRYLKDHFNGLDPIEVADLAATGMSVFSIWQEGHEFDDGAKAGSKAFAAAEAVGQPPFTPVYFAVDVSVDNPGGMHGGIPSPPLSDVVDYFADIRKGYLDYRAAGGDTPYYVGVYAARNVLDAVYRRGFATHFWQVWAWNWGPPNPLPPELTDDTWNQNAPGWRAWPHLNAWQVLLEDPRPAPDPLLVAEWDQNADVRACTTVIDLDVAWGDPGSWVLP